MGVGASRRRWGLGGVLTAGAPRPAAALQFPHIVEVPVSHLEGTRQILQQLGATKEEVGGWGRGDEGGCLRLVLGQAGRLPLICRLRESPALQGCKGWPCVHLAAG